MKKPLIAVIVLALLGIGFVAFTQPKSTCVNLYVDFGSLDSGSKIEKCIEAFEETPASDILKAAKLETQGTEKYGDLVVCRVNGLPDSSRESCKDMPAEDAYWALIIKEGEPFPLPFNTAGEWGWAEVGVAELKLHPGDSLGLVFVENGDIKWP